MFTGIIESVGTVESVMPYSEGMELLIRSNDPHSDEIVLGQSVCVSGICLTVSECGEYGSIGVFVSNETMRRSRYTKFYEGASVNIEYSLTMYKGIDGHIVTGHVDGVAQCVESKPDGASTFLEFSVANESGLGRCIAPKGSIAIDGVSMTVNDVNDTDAGTNFSVNLIPYTRDATTLGKVVTGTLVHIEVDILARYAMRAIETRVDE